MKDSHQDWINDFSRRLLASIKPHGDLPLDAAGDVETSAVRRSESSEALVRRMEKRYESWLVELPPEARPAIYVLLANGLAIKAAEFSHEGHDGVAVEGLLDDKKCLVVVHQCVLQILCVAEEVKDGTPRREIRFRINRRHDRARGKSAETDVDEDVPRLRRFH